MEANRLSEKAVQGFDDSAAYDKHRPSYPPQAVQTLLDAAGVSGVVGASLMDLAAGTGKFTELLAARDEHFRIVAVEPHHGMREQLTQKKLERVTVLDGLSTSIPAADDSVDAIFAAQAFHWFATEESLHEIHRVVKPGGVLGLIWNAEDYNTPLSYPVTNEWAAQIRSHLFSLDAVTNDHEPRFRHDKWRNVFENQVSSNPITAAFVGGSNSLFSLPLGEEKVPWTTWLEKEELWKRLRTMSHVAVLEGDNLKATRAVFDDALSGNNVERNGQGQIAVHGCTVLAWTTKIP